MRLWEKSLVVIAAGPRRTVPQRARRAQIGRTPSREVDAPRMPHEISQRGREANSNPEKGHSMKSGPKPRTIEENIMANMLIGSGCWLWAGPKDKNGYGSINVRIDGKHKRIPAHRAVYEYLIAKIPAGLEPDHVCRNRACVRPDFMHVELVTHAENMKRSGPFKQWTHCSKGHPLSGANLASTGPGKRPRCRTCKNARYKPCPKKERAA